MNRSLLLGLAMLGVATFGVAVAQSSDLLLDATWQRPRAVDTATVVPGRFLRRWDPVTVFFPSDKGPSGGGPEDAPDAFVTFDEDYPGAWTWLDRRTLQFRPAEPWPALEVVTARVRGQATDLFTLMTPPSRTTPSQGAVGLDPVSTLELTFAEPVDVASLAQQLSIELRPLPGLSDDGLQILTADDFEVKTLDRGKASDPVRVAITLAEPIGRGLAAEVHLQLSLDTAAREAKHVVRFKTAEPFRPAFLGCRDAKLPVGSAGTEYSSDQPLRCSGEREIVVRFSANLGTVGPVAARNLLRFEPAVEGLEFRTSGRELRVKGDFKQETRYRVVLAPTVINDRAGRELQMVGSSEVHVFFPRKAPFLSWKAGQGIVERLGAQKVPVSGRGHGQVDLRIHRVDPMNRELWPFPSSAIGVDESRQPAGPGEWPALTGEHNVVTTSSLRSKLKQLGSPAVSALAELPLSGRGGTVGLDLEPHLRETFGARAPGHYLVGIRKLDGGTTREWMRVQVTDLALSTVETGGEVRFFVTSMSTGQPVRGASVKVDATVTRKGKKTFESVVSGTTDAAGSFAWKAPGKQQNVSIAVRRISVAKDKDVLTLNPADAPEQFANGHWSRDRNTWLGWAFNSLSGREEAPSKLGHLFTERPVYRPEEAVHIKGYLRKRHLGRLSVLGGSGTVVVQAPGGTRWRYPVELTASGSFYAKFDEADVPTGPYRAWFEDSESVQRASVSFSVESYRLPTFEVDVTASGNASVVGSDEPFEVTASASYYAGGKVALRPVRWSVTQFPYRWTPEEREGFRYSSDSRYSRSSRFESTPALVRETTTDRNGAAVLSIDPSIEATAQPRTYVIEATITGADEQTVTAVRKVHAVPAFALGLKVPRVLDQAKKIDLEGLAVGPDGELVSGLDVTVRVLHRQWHSVLQASDFSDGMAKYVTDVVDEPHTERSFKTGAQPSAMSIPIDEAGVYIVELEARDKLGRVSVVTTDLYAGGEGQQSWKKAESGMFEISTDRGSYEPGETAKLLIRSPFQSGTALVVVEDPDGNSYHSVNVRNGAATFSLPIQKGWVPKVPVHVLLRRGRVAGAEPVGTLDLGKPQTLASTQWLTIKAVENTVDVALTNPPKAMPGETIPVTIELKDPKGNPLSGEVTLWLVDQAVLSLGTEQRLDPKPDFIVGRRSYFSAHDTRNLAFGELPFAEMPGGDGEMDEPMEEGVLGSVTVRKNFQPVPYFNPTIAVGTSGRKTVQVELPDNLTLFKIRAKAVHGAERFGAAGSQIQVQLPVVMQADLPRFVRPGDRFEVGALARVVEGEGGAASASVKVDGLNLLDPATADFSLDTAEASRIGWPVTVPTPVVDEEGELSRSSVSVTIGAKRIADGAGDAVQIELPLADDRRARVERQLLDLAVDDSVTIDALKEAARKGSVRRNVVVGDHPGLARMAGALDVFVQRPARSMGLQIDRARAWLGLGELRGSLGYGGEELVQEAVGEALAGMVVALDGREMLAAFPGGRGQVALTADGLLLIVEAEEAGYTVDAALKASLTRSLKRSLRSDYKYFLDGESWWERSKALEALASAGQFEEAYFSELGRNGRYLGSEGAASVLLAAARGGKGEDPMADQLVTRIADDVVVSLYEGSERYGGLESGSDVRSALVPTSEARTLSTMTRSLLRVRSDEAKVPLMVDALVRLGGEDGWGERANGPALLAMAERLKRSPGDPVKVSVDGETLTTANGGAASWSSADGDAVKVSHSSGPEGVVMASTRYVPSAPGSAAEARQKGFVVSRDHAVLQKSGPSVKHALEKAESVLRLKLGDVVEDHVQVVNPEDRSYVAVEVPLAAGLEPLNAALATAPPEAKASKSDTRSATWTKFSDDSVTYFFERLPKGTYDFYFRTRAATAGTFVQPPAISELLYDESVTGNSPGASVVVERD